MIASAASWLPLSAYALAGPGLWATVAWAISAGRAHMGKLFAASRRWRSQGGPDHGDDLPAVTALVPVKDEADGVAACVAGLLDQDYWRLNLIIVNDRSSDGTADILDRLASENPGRLRVLHVVSLPAGWLGKPHALHHAVTVAGDGLGEWLWLVDSDVRVEPHALSHLLGHCRERGYGFLSILVGLVAPTLAEKLVTPAAAAAWAACFRVADTNDDNRPDSAAANGQCMLLQRDLLAKVGGHAAVRDKTCEDVELARLSKKAGARVRFALGGHLASTRMHATPRQMFNGWARNFAGTARHRPGPLLVTLLMVWWAAAAWAILPVTLVFALPIWAGLATLHLGIVVGVLARIYRDSGRSWAASLGLASLFPITAIALTALLLNGVRACLGGRVAWRGDTVQA